MKTLPLSVRQQEHTYLVYTDDVEYEYEPGDIEYRHFHVRASDDRDAFLAAANSEERFGATITHIQDLGSFAERGQRTVAGPYGAYDCLVRFWESGDDRDHRYYEAAMRDALAHYGCRY